MVLQMWAAEPLRPTAINWTSTWWCSPIGSVHLGQAKVLSEGSFFLVHFYFKIQTNPDFENKQLTAQSSKKMYPPRCRRSCRFQTQHLDECSTTFGPLCCGGRIRRVRCSEWSCRSVWFDEFILSSLHVLVQNSLLTSTCAAMPPSVDWQLSATEPSWYLKVHFCFFYNLCEV